MNFNKTINLIILFSFMYNSVFAQKNTAKITYKKEKVLMTNIKGKDSLKYMRVNTFEKAQNKLLKNVTFELLCNNSESIFKASETLANDTDNKILKLAISIGGGGGIFYTNINTKKQLWEKEAFGHLFLVEKEVKDTKWTLVNETKKIGDYTCFKAIAKKRIRNKKGISYNNITAWYCPDIPLPFGPIEFCNLPGLILELEMKRVKFYVTEINLKFNKNITIKKPTKGEKVTYEELENIGVKVMSDMEKMLKTKKKN